ncbi:hypothetical protein AaE_014802, partial [Aphanomyces astaci]
MVKLSEVFLDDKQIWDLIRVISSNAKASGQPCSVAAIDAAIKDSLATRHLCSLALGEHETADSAPTRSHLINAVVVDATASPVSLVSTRMLPSYAHPKCHSHSGPACFYCGDPTHVLTNYKLLASDYSRGTIRDGFPQEVFEKHGKKSARRLSSRKIRDDHPRRDDYDRDNGDDRGGGSAGAPRGFATAVEMTAIALGAMKAIEAVAPRRFTDITLYHSDCPHVPSSITIEKCVVSSNSGDIVDPPGGLYRSHRDVVSSSDIGVTLVSTASVVPVHRPGNLSRRDDVDRAPVTGRTIPCYMADLVMWLLLLHLPALRVCRSPPSTHSQRDTSASDSILDQVIPPTACADMTTDRHRGTSPPIHVVVAANNQFALKVMLTGHASSPENRDIPSSVVYPLASDTSSCTPYQDYFSSYVPCALSLTVGNGSKLPVVGYGSIYMETLMSSTDVTLPMRSRALRLKFGLHCPQLRFNLLSVAHAADDGYAIAFPSRSMCTITTPIDDVVSASTNAMGLFSFHAIPYGRLKVGQAAPAIDPLENKVLLTDFCNSRASRTVIDDLHMYAYSGVYRPVIVTPAASPLTLVFIAVTPEASPLRTHTPASGSEATFWSALNGILTHPPRDIIDPQAFSVSVDCLYSLVSDSRLSNVELARLWHRRLGHPGIGALDHMIKENPDLQ